MRLLLTCFAPWPRSLWTLVLASLLLTVCTVRPAHCNLRELPQDPSRLRYGFRNASTPSQAPSFITAADLDGDRFAEEIKFSRGVDGVGHRQILRLTRWSVETLQQRRFLVPSGMAGVADVDGQTPPELFFWHQQGNEIVLQVLRATVENQTVHLDTLGTVSWDVGQWLLPNGEWSGAVNLAGAFDTDGDGTRESLVICVSGGNTPLPRGIWLCNWRKDEILWRVETGAAPTGEVLVGDFTGDGKDEIAVGLESPWNGMTAGDWDDSHAYVVLLGLDGDVRWHQEIGGWASIVKLAAVDIDGDGVLEVATAVGEYAEQDEKLSALQIWRGTDGSLIARQSFGCSVSGVAALDTPEGTRIYAAGADGRIRGFRYEQGNLILEDEVACGDPVTGLAPVSFEPPLAHEALVAVASGGIVAALDSHLRPLAVLRTGDVGGHAFRGILPASFEVDGKAEAGAMVVTGNQLHFLYLTRNPPPAWQITLFAAVAVVGGATCVPAFRRSTLAVLRRALTPRRGRGSLIDDLLSSLSTIGHGKFAAISMFNRLREQMAMLASLEESPPALEERFLEAVKNIREIGIPGINDIIHQAEQLGIAPTAVAPLRSSLVRFGRFVRDLPAALPSPRMARELRPELDLMLPALGDDLLMIRRTAERERSCVLNTQLERVLRSRASDITGAGARVERLDDGLVGNAKILATPAEVSFILDNLIANALDAIPHRSGGNIRIGIRPDDTRITVTVEDNGKGIPESSHAAIFREGVSSKPAGGHGLAKSREIIEKRGGSLKLVRSSPGEGATFAARFRLSG